MKKENMVDLVISREKQQDNGTTVNTSMSEELQNAIQSLIYRLRELGPIQTA
jgi:hypothetical protein